MAYSADDLKQKSINAIATDTDILFIEEPPNNKIAQCDLCGKDNDIVQMKGSGQFLCGNACDEEDEDED